MAEENEISQDQLDLLNGLMGELDEASKSSGGFSEENAINTCYLADGKFTARFFFDHNKKLFHEGWVYSGKTTATNDKGEKYEKKILCVTPKDDDPLRPIVTLLDDWHFNAQYRAVIFAEILEVDLDNKDQEKYFKKGLARIVVNKKFLSSLKDSLAYLAKKNPAEAIAAIDYNKPGYCFEVTVVRGNQGSVKFTPDLLGTKHTLDDAKKNLIKDLTDCKWIIPIAGSAENEANIHLMEEYYRSVLNDRNEYTDPKNKKSEEKEAEPKSEVESVAEEVLKDAPKKEEPKAEAAHEETAEERIARLEAALAAEKNKKA